jgi:hypothetical protein
MLIKTSGPTSFPAAAVRFSPQLSGTCRASGLCKLRRGPTRPTPKMDRYHLKSRICVEYSVRLSGRREARREAQREAQRRPGECICSWYLRVVVTTCHSNPRPRAAAIHHDHKIHGSSANNYPPQLSSVASEPHSSQRNNGSSKQVERQRYQTPQQHPVNYVTNRTAVQPIAHHASQTLVQHVPHQRQYPILPLLPLLPQKSK